MTPLGDGHGPDAPKHPTQRYLTDPARAAQIVGLADEHASAITALTSDAEFLSVLVLTGEKFITRLSAVAALDPRFATALTLLKGVVSDVETTMREKPNV